MITLPTEYLESSRPVHRGRQWLAQSRNSGAIVSGPSNLKMILNRVGPLPAGSSLVGRCTDGLPFLWDMQDPSPGSILITGGPNAGKSAVLRTILASAAILNNPSELQYYIITPDSGNFDLVYGYPNCKGQVSSYDRASTSLVIRMAELAEQRKSGRNRGAVVILAIDDLHSMLAYHEHELKSYLKWLAHNGPASSVWPVVSVDPAQVDQEDFDLFEEFGTHFTGQSDLVPYGSRGRNAGLGLFSAGSIRFSAIDAY